MLSDPYEREGRRAILNLGHTFAHALEAASGYELRHGDAVALGLLAALRLSGRPTDVVEEVLAPQPVRVGPRPGLGTRSSATRRASSTSCCSATRVGT